jgi:hypothetical protein
VIRVTSPPVPILHDLGHARRLAPLLVGIGTMMSYSFVRSPIYCAGDSAAAWMVVVALFSLLMFA